MGASLLLLLKNIKLKHIFIGLFILMCISNYYFYTQNKKNKEEFKRSEINFKQIINLKTTRIAELEFTSTEQLENFINTKEGLKKVIDSLKIKVKHLNSITYQTQTYIDTIPEIVTQIVLKDSIKPFYLPWNKKNECLEIKGYLKYSNDSLKVGVVESIFTNENTIVGYMERPQKNWFTRNFGRLSTKIEVVSTCGTNETIIITRKSKKKN